MRQPASSGTNTARLAIRATHREHSDVVDNPLAPSVSVPHLACARERVVREARLRAACHALSSHGPPENPMHTTNSCAVTRVPREGRAPPSISLNHFSSPTNVTRPAHAVGRGCLTWSCTLTAPPVCKCVVVGGWVCSQPLHRKCANESLEIVPESQEEWLAARKVYRGVAGSHLPSVRMPLRGQWYQRRPSCQILGPAVYYFCRRNCTNLPQSLHDVPGARRSLADAFAAVRAWWTGWMQWPVAAPSLMSLQPVSFEQLEAIVQVHCGQHGVTIRVHFIVYQITREVPVVPVRMVSVPEHRDDDSRIRGSAAAALSSCALRWHSTASATATATARDRSMRMRKDTQRMYAQSSRSRHVANLVPVLLVLLECSALDLPHVCFWRIGRTFLSVFLHSHRSVSGSESGAAAHCGTAAASGPSRYARG